jgi:hypothetical protein
MDLLLSPSLRIIFITKKLKQIPKGVNFEFCNLELEIKNQGLDI